MGDGIRLILRVIAIRKQRGVALIISLIILLMLTMLVTTSLRNASIDERIGNARDHSLAFQSTEGTFADRKHRPDRKIDLGFHRFGTGGQ